MHSTLEQCLLWLALHCRVPLQRWHYITRQPVFYISFVTDTLPCWNTAVWVWHVCPLPLLFPHLLTGPSHALSWGPSLSSSHQHMHTIATTYLSHKGCGILSWLGWVKRMFCWAWMSPSIVRSSAMPWRSRLTCTFSKNGHIIHWNWLHEWWAPIHNSDTPFTVVKPRWTSTLLVITSSTWSWQGVPTESPWHSTKPPETSTHQTRLLTCVQQTDTIHTYVKLYTPSWAQ